jgi:hypothetical protein
MARHDTDEASALSVLRRTPPIGARHGRSTQKRERLPVRAAGVVGGSRRRQ